MSAEKGWLPLFDFAYQGFANGLEQDAAGLRAFAANHQEMLVASSYSKNFGLYNERVGAFTLVAADEETAARAFSQVKSIIRTLYSNPASHGGNAFRLRGVDMVYGKGRACIVISGHGAGETAVIQINYTNGQIPCQALGKDGIDHQGNCRKQPGDKGTEPGVGE